jgi:DNA replication protein DnaC
MSAAEAAATCALCDKPILGESVTRNRRGQPCAIHADCWARFEIEVAADKERRLKLAKSSIRRSFLYDAKHEHLEQAVGGLPDWPFARFENSEFRARASKTILSALEQYRLQDGLSLLICGETGVGKTGGVVARLYGWLDEAVAAAVPESDVNIRRFEPHFFFVTGHELAGSRRNWKLGEDCPIVLEAKRIELLILDELGFEPASELPFEVIDHRYRQRLVTIVTTGRKPKEFRDRYGDAMYRRLVENGALLEDFP